MTDLVYPKPDFRVLRVPSRNKLTGKFNKKKNWKFPLSNILHSNTSMNHLNELIDTRNHGIKMMNTFPSILVTHHSQFSLPGILLIFFSKKEGVLLVVTDLVYSKPDFRVLRVPWRNKLTGKFNKKNLTKNDD